MSHPIIIWPDSPLVLPVPEGFAYDTPDENGAVHSYWNALAVAEFNYVAQHQPALRKTVKATIAEIVGMRDQYRDVAPDLTNLACANVRFVNNVNGPEPGLDPSGNAAGVYAWAWPCNIADGRFNYRNMLQVNVNRGYTGQQGAVA